MNRTKITLRVLLVLACSGLLAFLPSVVAFAHANLVRSDPERGAVLAKAPTSITLEFSEALDPQLSQVKLIDSHSQIIAPGPGVIDPANPTIMKLSLPVLPDGTYTALWQTHSAADGHFASGSVGFSVGKSDPAVSLLPPENTSIPSQALPTLPDILLRWAGYLAAALIGGGIYFGALVWRPAYRSSSQPDDAADQAAARLLKTQIIAAAAALALVTALSVLYQAWTASTDNAQTSYSSALLSLIGFTGSWELWLRLALLAIIVVLVNRLPAPGGSRPGQWSALLPLVVLVMATFSLKSHSAALNNPLSIILDIIHLTAMSAWFGGLLPLFLLLKNSALSPALLVPRFTNIALTSVALLALTGLYSAVQEVQTLDGLTSTSYGISLLLKVGLFGLLVGLGAVNFLILTPRFTKDQSGAVRRLQISMRAEIILGIALLAIVGILAGTTPSFQAAQATRQMGVIGDYQENGIQMRLWLAPGITGVNEVAADVSGLTAGANGAAAQVLFRFSMTDLEMNMGTTQATATTSDQKRYLVRGSYFTMAGIWNIEAILRLPGQNDIVHNFLVTIQTDPNDPNPSNPEPITPESLAAGNALYQANCVLCHGASGKGDGPAGRALIPPPADLTYHTIPGVHTDGELYFWISNGLPRTAMPAFAGSLSETQRWDLVNFIRTLARPAK